jgi:hypothetical protein
MSDALKAYTRRTAPEFLTQQGYPIGQRQFIKACLPSSPDPVPVDYWFGERAMYKPETLIAWAQMRVKANRNPRKPGTPAPRRRGRPRKLPVPVDHIGPDAA